MRRSHRSTDRDALYFMPDSHTSVPSHRTDSDCLSDTDIHLLLLRMWELEESVFEADICIAGVGRHSLSTTTFGVFYPPSLNAAAVLYHTTPAAVLSSRDNSNHYQLPCNSYSNSNSNSNTSDSSNKRARTRLVSIERAALTRIHTHLSATAAMSDTPASDEGTVVTSVTTTTVTTTTEPADSTDKSKDNDDKKDDTAMDTATTTDESSQQKEHKEQSGEEEKQHAADTTEEKDTEADTEKQANGGGERKAEAEGEGEEGGEKAEEGSEKKKSTPRKPRQPRSKDTPPTAPVDTGRPKRTHKAPEVYNPTESATSRADHTPLEIKKGKGKRLGDIENVEHRVGLTRTTAPSLILLHRVLFPLHKAHPVKTTIKGHIREFSGWSGDEEADAARERLEKKEAKELKVLAELLDVASSGSKQQLVDRIVEFCHKPAGSGHAFKSKKRKSTSSSSSSKGKGGKKGSAGKAKRKGGGMNAYMFFVADRRAAGEAEGRSVSEFGKECGEKWREMRDKDKQKYKDKAEKAKKEKGGGDEDEEEEGDEQEEEEEGEEGEEENEEEGEGEDEEGGEKGDEEDGGDEEEEDGEEKKKAGNANKKQKKGDEHSTRQQRRRRRGGRRGRRGQAHADQAA